MTACSEEPKPATKKEPEKPAEPVSSQLAFQRMYVVARAWMPDAKPLSLSNIDLKEVKSEGGKAGAWECTFVSEQRHRARRYTYSVVESAPSNLPQGVFGGPEDVWSEGSQQKPFFVQSFKVDATAAYATAMKKGADYAKKHPDSPMKFVLEAKSRYQNPAWRVIWGESAATSSFSILVDATTGEYLKTMH